ncbi:hypothetical protein U1Q18_039361 [Sarracenia purpurea var. burkii]
MQVWGFKLKAPSYLELCNKGLVFLKLTLLLFLALRNKGEEAVSSLEVVVVDSGAGEVGLLLSMPFGRRRPEEPKHTWIHVGKGKGIRSTPQFSLSDLPSSSTTLCDFIGVTQQTKFENKFAYLQVDHDTVDSQHVILQPMTGAAAPTIAESKHLQFLFGEGVLPDYASKLIHPVARLETLPVDNASDDDLHSLDHLPHPQSRVQQTNKKTIVFVAVWSLASGDCELNWFLCVSVGCGFIWFPWLPFCFS